MTIESKQCTKCKEVKALACFSMNRTRSDGLHYYCRDCIKAKDAVYAARKAEIRRARAEAHETFQPNPVILKRCGCCDLDKPQTEFHISRRDIDGLQSSCKICTAKFGADYRAKNPEKNRQRQAVYYFANKERCDAKTNRWIQENRDKTRAYSRKSFLKRHEKELARHRLRYWSDTERAKQATREWRSNNVVRRQIYERAYIEQNRHLVNAKNARRRAAIIKAAVAWADKEKIRAFYEMAQQLTRETGIEHHVDHIVPLRSPLVCGLHNEFNLQILTESENSRKNNKFEPLDLFIPR